MKTILLSILVLCVSGIGCDKNGTMPPVVRPSVECGADLESPIAYYGEKSKGISCSSPSLDGFGGWISSSEKLGFLRIEGAAPGIQRLPVASVRVAVLVYEGQHLKACSEWSGTVDYTQGDVWSYKLDLLCTEEGNSLRLRGELFGDLAAQ